MLFTIVGIEARSQEETIRLEPYQNFETKWHLVTVRFRKDTNEQRFVYANPLAWRHLQSRAKGKTNSPFPDGSVFAKTGIATHEDEAFPSSSVPNGVRRFQLMIRDSKIFKETDGWGYGLFDEKGETSFKSPHKEALACAACHKIVPERDFVFSLPMAGLVPRGSSPITSLAKKNWSFIDKDAAELVTTVSDLLPVGTKTVRLLTGTIATEVFEGTLDEIRPLLSQEVSISSHPALLQSQDGKQFSLVYKVSADKQTDIDAKSRCPKGQLSFIAIKGRTDKKTAEKPFHFCYQKSKSQ